MNIDDYCCADFAEQAERDEADVGTFVRIQKGSWNINGCCGGGCFVVYDMIFCPFCGTYLEHIEDEH